MSTIRQLALGTACLLIAAVIFGLGFTTVAFRAERTAVTIYPAGFFALLGLALIARAWWVQARSA